jgi:transposase
MAFQLTEAERSRLRSMVKRPRSRKQLYRAEALLALDEGLPIETVARRFRVGVERVEQWMGGFEAKRIGYLTEPPGPGPKARWLGRDPEPDPGEAEVEED